MTTIQALQNYYVSQGGTLADVANLTTIPAMIEAITALTGTPTNNFVQTSGSPLRIETGMFTLENFIITAGGYYEFDEVEFTKSFTGTPVVMLNMCEDKGAQNPYLTVSAYNDSGDFGGDSFYGYVRNSSTESITVNSMAINWIAIGI